MGKKAHIKNLKLKLIHRKRVGVISVQCCFLKRKKLRREKRKKQSVRLEEGGAVGAIDEGSCPTDACQLLFFFSLSFLLFFLEHFFLSFSFPFFFSSATSVFIFPFVFHSNNFLLSLTYFNYLLYFCIFIQIIFNSLSPARGLGAK